jgi:hypothetical protein
LLVKEISVNTHYRAYAIFHLRTRFPLGTVFEKAGFDKVYWIPANDVMLETNLRIKSEKLGAKQRYQYWQLNINTI